MNISEPNNKSLASALSRALVLAMAIVSLGVAPVLLSGCEDDNDAEDVFEEAGDAVEDTADEAGDAVEDVFDDDDDGY